MGCYCSVAGEDNCEIHRGDRAARANADRIADAARSSVMLPTYLFERIVYMMPTDYRTNGLDKENVTKEQLIWFYDEIRKLLPR